MADPLPVICSAYVENGVDTIEVFGTDASTGEAVVLSDLNCRPPAGVFLAGIGYLVKELIDTTHVRLERIYEGATSVNPDPGVSCTISPFTPEMASRVALSQQLRDYSALVTLLREDWNGLVYTYVGPTGAADPGSGNLAFDNANPAEIAGLYLDVNDTRGRNVAGQVMTWQTNTQVRVQSLATGAFVTVRMSAAPVNQGPDEWIENAGVSLVGEAYGQLVPGEKVALIYVIEGEGLAVDKTVDTLAERDAYDGEAEGFTVKVMDVGDGRMALFTKLSATSADWSDPGYLTGPEGMSAYEVAVANGFVGNEAAWLLSLIGPKGDKGWSPQLVAEADGARRVMKLLGYTGGEGAAPTANVGEYLKADGTFTANIAEAVDFRGAGGPPGLDGASQYIRVHGLDTTDSDPATSGYENGLTLGGRTAATGERYLRASAGHPERNGIWLIAASGGATRDPAFATFDSMPGIAVRVMEGDGADATWNCNSDQGGTFGTDPLVFEEAAGGVEDGDYGDVVVSGDGTVWSLKDTYRRNQLLLMANSAKALAGYQRFLDTFADGYKASDGVAAGSSSNYTIDTSTGCVKPTIALGVTTVTINSGVSGTTTGFTLIDRTTALLNGITVYKIGVYSTAAATIKVKIYERLTATTGTVVVDQSFSHPGGGWADCTLSSPYSVPGSGTFYLGAYTAGNVDLLTTNVTRTFKSGDVTGSASGMSEDTGAGRTYAMRYSHSSSIDNMTIVTTLQTADAARTKGRILLEVDDVTGGSTINTHLTAEFSCNNQANHTLGTLTLCGLGQGGRKVYETEELTCTSGSTLSARIKTAGNRDIRLYKTAWKAAA